MNAQMEEDTVGVVVGTKTRRKKKVAPAKSSLLSLLFLSFPLAHAVLIFAPESFLQSVVPLEGKKDVMLGKLSCSYVDGGANRIYLLTLASAVLRKSIQKHLK